MSLPDEVHREIEDALVLVELAREAEDEGMAAEITQAIDEAEKKLHKLEMNSLFVIRATRRTSS